MEHEITIRLISFVLIFILVALWEIRAPRRARESNKKWFFPARKWSICRNRYFGNNADYCGKSKD